MNVSSKKQLKLGQFKNLFFEHTFVTLCLHRTHNVAHKRLRWDYFQNFMTDYIINDSDF